MPIVKTVGEYGHTLRLLETERTRNHYHVAVFAMPEFQQEEEINAWDSWESREDDIILCAYPKSGTHWLWEIIAMLLNGNSERINDLKESYMMEAIPKDKFDNLQSPRILNTHVYYKHLPIDIKKKHTKFVYLMRNPKDVAVSFYHHHKKIVDYGYRGQWSDYLPRFIEGKVDYGSWFNYVLDWNYEIDNCIENPVHFVTYEDLKTNCVKELRRLANFLSIDDNEELFQSITEACNFKKMKTEKDLLEDPEEWKNKEPGIYRKGAVGDWKNWFTVAESEMFDSIYRSKLHNIHLDLRFTS